MFTLAQKDAQKGLFLSGAASISNANTLEVTMNRKILYLAVLCLALLAILSGCKFVVIAPSGGDVESASRSRDCWAGNICEFQVTDASFSETFTAIARPGYQFVKWQDGGGFVCVESTNPICAVQLTGDALSQAIVATLSAASIKPIFKDIGIDSDSDGTIDRDDTDDDEDGIADDLDACPLDPTPACNGVPRAHIVSVDGKEWVQVHRFSLYSWDDISATCSPITGVCGGVLWNGINGVGNYDMTGWIWASTAEVNEMFNYFIGSNELGTEADEYLESDSAFAPSFYSRGWRPTIVYSDGSRATFGITRTLSVSDPTKHHTGRLADLFDDGSGGNDYARTAPPGQTTNNRNSAIGAWFYRTP